jgi:YjbE family integral membrane protein
VDFLFAPEFWAALVKIIGVNIILSGDNAVVIALACRSLPPRQQKLGIIFGAGAAVVLRIIFTFIVVALMAIPYLKFVGGLLLFWIGYKLTQPEHEGEKDVNAASNLMGAVRTVLIADAVMSLDNVIAVAGAAEAYPPAKEVLIGLGLLISIPLVVFGAAILIKLIGRYPIIVTLGAALIGWVGGEVIVTDPAWSAWVDEHAHWLHWGGPLIGAILVIAIGKLLARPHEPTKLEDLEEKKKSEGVR